MERERAAVAARDELRGRLNEALPTRDSSRGLIAEIGGVQFATGTADANAAAREGLSKFSGIVASYPELRFNVEGHTDSTGSATMNQELSLKRATTVRDYLIAQGVPASRIDVAGLGLSAPIGDNTTTDGRAPIRRVEIVVSGAPLTTTTHLGFYRCRSDGRARRGSMPRCAFSFARPRSVGRRCAAQPTSAARPVESAIVLRPANRRPPLYHRGSRAQAAQHFP